MLVPSGVRRERGIRPGFRIPMEEARPRFRWRREDHLFTALHNDSFEWEGILDPTHVDPAAPISATPERASMRRR